MPGSSGKIKNILLWSLIAAAFIGPGTVTTASASGSHFDYQLLWALAFATVCCFLVQEAVARLTIENEKPLLIILQTILGGRYAHSWALGIVLAIVSGCIAYQAGNIVGAARGIGFIRVDIRPEFIVLAISVLVILMLSFRSYGKISNVLSVVVAVMGISFLFIALTGEHPAGEVAGGFVPQLPRDSDAYILGLLGTTIVPYNLFLGSGLSKGQKVSDMRIGLLVSVGLGGVISMAILVGGSAIEPPFSFEKFGETLSVSVGSWSVIMLGVGLLAAGFTSAVTAPLAAAEIVRQASGVKNRQRNHRITWLVVVLTGLVFGVVGIRPVPLIIFAQAVNGLLLPALGILLWIALHHAETGTKIRLPIWYDLMFGLAVAVMSYLGLSALSRFMVRYLLIYIPTEVIGLCVLIIMSVVSSRIYRLRRRRA